LETPPTLLKRGEKKWAPSLWGTKNPKRVKTPGVQKGKPDLETTCPKGPPPHKEWKINLISERVNQGLWFWPRNLFQDINIYEYRFLNPIRSLGI